MPKTNAVLSQTAYEYILDLIMTKQLHPGEKVPETAIAEKFHISRTPVRDAIQQLTNEGLLEAFPNRYSCVKKYTHEEITEIGTLRLALDSLSVKLAILFGSRINFLELGEIADQCTMAYKEGNHQLKCELDCKFHMHLVETTGNQILIKTQREMYKRIQYILLCNPNTSLYEDAHIQQHSELVSALIESNDQLANQIIINHLSDFYNLKNKYPKDFFD